METQTKTHQSASSRWTNTTSRGLETSGPPSQENAEFFKKYNFLHRLAVQRKRFTLNLLPFETHALLFWWIYGNSLTPQTECLFHMPKSLKGGGPFEKKKRTHLLFVTFKGEQPDDDNNNDDDDEENVAPPLPPKGC